MDIANLVNDLRKDILQQVEMESQLPVDVEYTFDPLSSGEELCGKHLSVQKTTRRTVVSLNFSKFQAKEVIREDKRKAGSTGTNVDEFPQQP